MTVSRDITNIADIDGELSGAFADKVARETAEARAALPPDEIRAHWQDWARQYGTSLRATTKRPTAKRMEVDALARAFRRLGAEERSLSVLEVGCGNGLNCVELAGLFPQARFTGVDYVPEMVEAARDNAEAAGVPGAVRFLEGDVLALESLPTLDERYDVVFTVRCLINLDTADKQISAIDRLHAKTGARGHLILVENCLQTYERQNDCREILGLHRRTPERFNLFLDERVILPHLRGLFREVGTEDFISFHDLVLYVLTPLLCGGRVDHDHPLVAAATRLNIAISESHPGAFGAFGQNRLYHCTGPARG